MFQKKFNWKFWFFLVFFALALCLFARVVWMLAGNEVSDENGVPLSRAASIGMIVLLTLPSLSYLLTVVELAKHGCKYKGTAFSVDEKGIHNALTFVNVLCFMFVGPIRFIPWQAVTYLDAEQEGVYIRVNTKKIQTSFLGRIITKVLGWSFGFGFIKPALTDTEKAAIVNHIRSKAEALTEQATPTPGQT